MEEEKKEEALSAEDLMAMWEEALKEASSSASPQSESSDQKTPSIPSEPSTKTAPKPEVSPSPLKELTPKEEGTHPELDFILDIPLEISVEIGRTKMLIKDLLKLNQGSVIELEKFAGEPVEIYVNGKLMARGEVVVVNDRFGVRITEIISAQERIRRLGN
ncbi:MAG: flagellar motor switch protein FliN [Caldimicrobium sp.]